MVPLFLRKLFILHFILDYMVALPLMFAPKSTMILLGWDAPEPVATRLVAAALMGIGGISLIAYKANVETFRHMLTMKLLWSGTAVLGLVLSLIEGAPAFTWIFMIIFAGFYGIWFFYRIKLN